MVPSQRAGAIAQKTGLVNANNRWCMVIGSLESTAAPGVHARRFDVVGAGDAEVGPWRTSTAIAVAAAIVETLNGRAPQPMMANTCYSFIDDKNVVHVASVHRYVPGRRRSSRWWVRRPPAANESGPVRERVGAQHLNDAI